MRVTNSATGRPAYYDRTPLQKSFGAARFTAGPAALTTRATYTVPSNKKAFIDACSSNVERRGVATTAVVIENHVFFNPVAGGTVYLSYSATSGNTIGATDHSLAGNCGFMAAGDVISAEDFNGDTGGTYDSLGAAKVVEYDA